MKKVFAALREELRAGRGAVLCSIVSSSGSTPRGAGAKMLVREDGTALGTIGGGAVEYRSIQLAGELSRQRRSHLQSYRLSSGEVADIGMICGGNVQVYFQYFDPSDRAQLPVLDAVLELLDGGRAAWLVTAAAPDGAWRMGTYDKERGLRFLEGIDMDRVEPLLGSRCLLAEGEDLLCAEPLGRGGTVYLFGGGHVGRELAHILSMADFRVVVYDERPHAADRAYFPDVSAVLCGPYAQALERVGPIREADYVVIMTPGHQADYTVLSQVRATPARYIGCIGSRKKVAITRQRLLADGFAQAEIDRVHAPIGLPIGGETPAEVAVSVAAEMIACRSGRLTEGGTLR